MHKQGTKYYIVSNKHSPLIKTPSTIIKYILLCLNMVRCLEMPLKTPNLCMEKCNAPVRLLETIHYVEFQHAQENHGLYGITPPIYSPWTL